MFLNLVLVLWGGNGRTMIRFDFVYIFVKYRSAEVGVAGCSCKVMHTTRKQILISIKTHFTIQIGIFHKHYFRTTLTELFSDHMWTDDV